MSLDALFEDRIRRKNIRDGINCAEDIGEGVCKCCGEHTYVLEAFHTQLCESCCNKLLAVSEDYDIEMPKEVTEEVISDLISESWVYLDTKKLQAEADKNYNGDVKALLKVYKISPVNMDMAGGRIELSSTAQKRGKTRVNQLILDFDGSHATEKVALNQCPDADGTLAPPRVKGKDIGGGKGQNLANVKTPASNAASTKSVVNSTSTSNSGANQSASKSVKVVAGVVSGNKDNFTFKVGDAEFKVGSFGNDYALILNGKDLGNLPSNISKDIENSKDVSKSVEIVKAELAKNPQNYFDTFNGVSSGVISIPKYSIYKFCFDEKSFEKDLSMCVVYNGKLTKARFNIPNAIKALTNKAYLMNGLTEYMEGVIGKKYPVFTKKNNIFKTSLGNVVVELEDMQGEDLILNITWGNNTFKVNIKSFEISSDVKKAQMDLKKLLESNLDKMISGIFDKDLGYKGNTNFMRLEHTAVIDGKKVLINAQFNSSAFENSSNGELEFIIQIKVDNKIYPEMDGDSFVVRSKDKDIRVFFENAAKELYTKYVVQGATNSTGDAMTPSAIAKMNNPSKRVAFLTKVGDKFLAEIAKNAQGDKEAINNSSIDLDMKIDKDGGVISVVFSLTADDSDEYSSVENYKDKLNAELIGYKWIEFLGAKEDGNDFVAMYRVNKDKIPYFIDLVELPILEDYAYLLELFGRKQINAIMG